MKPRKKELTPDTEDGFAVPVRERSKMASSLIWAQGYDIRFAKLQEELHIGRHFVSGRGRVGTGIGRDGGRAGGSLYSNLTLLRDPEYVG